MKRTLLFVVVISFLSFSFSLFAQEKKEKVVSVSVPEAVPEVEISVVGSKIIIQHATVGKKIEIYSVIGKKIGDIEIKHTSAEYPINVPRGYYILKIEETVRKVAIR